MSREFAPCILKRDLRYPDLIRCSLVVNLRPVSKSKNSENIAGDIAPELSSVAGSVDVGLTQSSMFISLRLKFISLV